MRSRYLPALGLAALAWSLLPAVSFGQIRDDLEALKTLKVPEGFEVRLFAGKDLIQNPTSIDVDIYGRVWVCEGKNYRSSFNKGPGPLDPDADRIKVLEDTQGTGKADKVTTFLDKIPIVPMSVCVVGDQVYAGVAPQLWLFDGADTKDPVAKNKKVLLDGIHRSGRKGPAWADHDHTIHGLLLGPDGRMFFTVGDEGMKTNDNDGAMHAPNGGAMVRMNLDGKKMKVLADNFRNPYELCVDSFGRVFCSDNDDDGNAQVRICQVWEGGDYGYHHNPKLPASPTKHHWHEDVPGVTPKLLRTFAGSPCGIIFYEGNLLPERFRGSLIHADCGAPQAVRAYHMKPDGIGYKLEIENILTSTDKWYRPTDVAVAADGSLYVSDWYDSAVGGHSFRKRDIGRIYHVTMKGAPPPAKTASPDLKTIPGLLSTLMSPVPSVRYLAIAKLRERSAESLEPLKKLALEGKHPMERARALWVLFGMGEAGEKVISEMLKDKEPQFRALAVRILREKIPGSKALGIMKSGSDARDELQEVVRFKGWLENIELLANDESPEVREEVTIALREIPTNFAKIALTQLATRFDPKDIYYGPQIGSTLKNREPEFVKELFASSTNPADEARLVTLAYQLQRVEAVPFLAGVLKSSKDPQNFAKALEALSWISDLSAAEAVATAAATDPDAAHCRAALDMLKRKIGSDWKAITTKPVFEQVFERCQKDATLLPPTLALIGTAQAQNYIPKVLEMIDKPGTDKALRRAALEALGQVKSPATIKKLAEVLATAKLPEKPPEKIPATDELAFAAVNALYNMNTPEANKVVEGMALDRAYPTDIRLESVKLLGRSPNGCRFLLASAEKNTLPPDVKGEAVQVTNRSPDKNVRDLAAKILPLPKLAGNRTLPPLNEILQKKGDDKKGQAVFFKQESLCSKCHRVGGVGAWVGPDLSQVGAKFAKEGLLNKILNPNSSIAHGYTHYNIETQKGQLFAGLIVDESPERLTLKNAEGERILLPAKDVASKTALPTSIMPEGLVQTMTDGDLVDLLAYLGTLRQPAISVPQWQVIGPFAPDAIPSELEKTFDLKATYPGKGGEKVSWRKVSADREGRLDLEAALGTRAAGVYLHAPVQSKDAQQGRIVLLVPADAKLSAWLDGKEVKFTEVKTTGTNQALIAQAADLPLKGGKNDLLIKIVGGEKGQLVTVSTLVSPQGVDVPAN